MENGSPSSGLVEYIGYAVGALGTVVATVMGIAFKQYAKFESRLANVETRIGRVDNRTEILIDQHKELATKQDRIDQSREEMLVTLTKIEAKLDGLVTGMKYARKPFNVDDQN